MTEGYAASKGSQNTLSFSIRPSPALSPRFCSCSQPPKPPPQPQAGQEEGKRVKAWGSSYPKPAEDPLLASGTPQSPGASLLPFESQNTVSLSCQRLLPVKVRLLQAVSRGIRSQVSVPASLILPAKSSGDGLGSPTPRSCFTPLPPPKALAASGEFEEGGKEGGSLWRPNVSPVAARNNRPPPPHLEGRGVHTLGRAECGAQGSEDMGRKTTCPRRPPTPKEALGCLRGQKIRDPKLREFDT